ncbi:MULTISPECIES: nicotinate mononucleotide-dependent phosphoribosyltransferase CobT [Acidianus]|uniref:nicotinate mononucleotide-dependent phosphoribosyltransferase CobT n=1 Tax=Acidianus TaxID=12914 RepID=UPI00064E54A1|nr:MULTISPECIES: TIGR00303 family protein [Acidianus]NON63463.1 TIGR00303 family protein [Acidianus sp. RZ1]
MIKDVIGNFSQIIEKERDSLTFLLTIGTTDVSLIPGITIAGATPELTHYTPAADAEFLLLGRCLSLNVVPVTPDGLPTPAVISRSSLSLIKSTKIVVNAGSKINPKIPYIDIGGKPGKDIRKGSFDEVTIRSMLRNGEILGNELNEMKDFIVIGESIPAGTTTAMAVLVGLGYDAYDKMSSASPQNPKSLKRKIVEEATKGLSKNVYDIMTKISDPVLVSIASFALGFKGKILLAGGTQMIAAAAIIKELKGSLSNVAVGTTKWIIKDNSSDIVSLAKDVGVNLLYADVDFSNSRFDGIKAYEKGYIKEGVGSGGSMIMAMSKGIKEDDILKKIEETYSDLLR